MSDQILRPPDNLSGHIFEIILRPGCKLYRLHKKNDVMFKDFRYIQENKVLTKMYNVKEILYNFI